LFAVFVNHADFARPDAIVDADKRLGRTFIECDGAPPLAIRANRPDRIQPKFRPKSDPQSPTNAH
jgi:hypothetical protein